MTPRLDYGLWLAAEYQRVRRGGGDAPELRAQLEETHAALHPSEQRLLEIALYGAPVLPRPSELLS